MKNIIVRTRETAEVFTSPTPWAAIQISNSTWPTLNCTNLVDSLKLYFYDQQAPSLAYPGRELFEQEHAKLILDFVTKNKDKIDTLLVHCEKGMSRSPAVAAVIDHCYFHTNPKLYFTYYKPNKLVYRILFEEANRQNLCGPLLEIPEYVIIDENEFGPNSPNHYMDNLE